MTLIVCALAIAQENTGQRVVVPARNTSRPRVVKVSTLNSGVTVKTHTGKDVIVETAAGSRSGTRGAITSRPSTACTASTSRSAA